MASQNRLEHDYSLLRILGSGAFGVVYDCKHKLDEKRCAVKITFLKDPSVLKEVASMAKLPHHDNTVHYFSCWEDTMKLNEIKRIMGSEFSNFTVQPGIENFNLLFISMELCSDDLRTWLGLQSSVSEEAHASISFQLAKGLEHIHNHGIIHRDLKPENIFLSLDKSLVKIGDFGISATNRTTSGNFSLTKGVGTPLYLAPEQETTKYGKEVDVFALGLILFELSWPELQPSRNRGDVQNLLSALTALKFRAKFPANFNKTYPKLALLIERMIEFDPQERAKIFEIIAFFSSKTMKQSVVDSGTNLVIPGTNIHYGINCNGCGKKNIEGFRYSCTVCTNYNICRGCEGRVGIHPETHPLVRVVSTPKDEEAVTLNSLSLTDEKNVKKVRNSCELQKALKECQPGDVIELGEGAYTGDFVVQVDNVKIYGKIREKTIFSPGESSFALVVKSNKCRISDIHFELSKATVGLQVTGNQNIIENISSRGTEYFTVVFADGEKNVLRNISSAENLDKKTAAGSSNFTLVFLCGKYNKVQDCKSDFGVFFLQCSLSILQRANFCFVLVSGESNTLRDVVVTRVMCMYGKGHHLIGCSGPLLSFSGNEDKISMHKSDNSFKMVNYRCYGNGNPYFPKCLDNCQCQNYI